MHHTRARWFQLLAEAIREIADTCGGAFVMTIDRLREEAKDVRPDLGGCPECVWNHFSLALPRQAGLQCRRSDGGVVTIFDSSRFDIRTATEHCKKLGIPDDVMIAQGAVA